MEPAPALFIVTQLVKDNQQQSLAPNVINDCVTGLSNDTVYFDMDRAPSSSLCGDCTCYDHRRSYVEPAPALLIVTQLVKDNQEQSLAPNVI